MEPEPQNLLFLLVDLWLSQVDALENLGNITQVEQIVALLWGRKEAFNHSVEHLDGAHRQRLCQALDVLHTEVVQLILSQGDEDSLDLRVRLICEAKVVAIALKALRDHGTTSTRWAHCVHHVNIQDIPERLLLTIIPAAIVHPLPKKFQWRLGSVHVFSWHVEIIHKHQHSLVASRPKLVLDTLLNLALHDLLYFFSPCHR
mmetsp:Transcript_43794/g.78688  ORF Transcript_43794/g.78688 Transcript_43794/m.78688 type:complete len:202 (+) Transcript_43794:5493-6098(+)